MRAVDGFTTTFTTTTTTASFQLSGGLYGLDAITQGGGTVTLQKLGGDGLTYLAAMTAATAAAPYQTANLPRGTYRVVAAAVTSWTSLARIPGE